MVFQKVQNSLKKLREKAGLGKPDLDYLDNQDLSRFSEQDIICLLYTSDAADE